MIDKAELLALIDHASDWAATHFKHVGNIQPMYHAVTEDGQHLVTPTPDADKDVAVVLIKSLFKLRKVVRYVFIDEAWILEAPDRNVGNEEMKQIARKGLEGHPDRREIVMFSAENRAGMLLMAHRYILRPEHGKAKLSPLKFIDMSRGSSEGRMVGLLTGGRA